MVGTLAMGTSAAKGFAIGGSTAPTTRPADMIQMWSADFAAGDARLYILSESNTNPTVIGNGIVSSQRTIANQSSTTRAEPVAFFTQADVSEEFIRFQGTAAVSNLTQSIVDVGDVATATTAGYLKMYVIDDGNQITDQAYYVPIVTLA